MSRFFIYFNAKNHKSGLMNKNTEMASRKPVSEGRLDHNYYQQPELEAQCWRFVSYLAVQLSLLLGVLSVFGLRQQRIQRVHPLLLSRLLVFTLRTENSSFRSREETSNTTAFCCLVLFVTFF